VEEFVYRGVLYAPLQAWLVSQVRWLFACSFHPHTRSPILAKLRCDRGGSASQYRIDICPGLLRQAAALYCYSPVFNGIQAAILIVEPHLQPLIPSASGAAPPLRSIVINWLACLTSWIAKLWWLVRIGGLTVAALLAARGGTVCLLERESRVGGCAASFDKFGYTFEQGYGLYAFMATQ